MTEFSWEKILLIVFGGGGIVVSIVALFKFIAERYDLVKKERKEETDQHTSLMIENRKLDLTEEERNRLEFQEILEIYKKRIEDLKDEIRNLKETDSLSRPIITRIYQNVRSLRRQIDQLDWQIERQVEHANLSKQMTQVKTILDELEKQLP